MLVSKKKDKQNFASMINIKLVNRFLFLPPTLICYSITIQVSKLSCMHTILGNPYVSFNLCHNSYKKPCSDKHNYCGGPRKGARYTCIMFVFLCWIKLMYNSKLCKNRVNESVPLQRCERHVKHVNIEIFYDDKDPIIVQGAIVWIMFIRQ